MLAATRQIEAAARVAGGSLLVGFQRAEKLDGEAATYRRLVAAGVRVTAFGTGEPGSLPGVDWVRLPEDQAALQNQWLLVAEQSEPIAFVGFETSESRTASAWCRSPTLADLHRVRDRRPAIDPGHRRASGDHQPYLTKPSGHRERRKEASGAGRRLEPRGPTRRRRGGGDQRSATRPSAPWCWATCAASCPATRPRTCCVVISTGVWKNRDRYDPDRSLEAWVLAIARKRAIDQIRRRHANVVPIEELRGHRRGRRPGRPGATPSAKRGARGAGAPAQGAARGAHPRLLRRAHPDRDRRAPGGAAGHRQGPGLPRPAPPGRAASSAGWAER